MTALREFAHDSERLFAEYLDKYGLHYSRDVVVDPGDVDFLISAPTGEVYCDVKAVEALPEIQGKIDAHYAIRDDVRALRGKFKDTPSRPCILVTMNYSPQIITGLTIRMAMLGDLGVEFMFSEESVGVSEMAHMRKGNAALTRQHSTGVSGILAFDCAHGGPHCYFPNPYAKLPLADGVFPNVIAIPICKADGQETFLGESELMFFPIPKDT